ncbi:12505_t:CDS:2 [Cetraspora pellucida]|uniref:12505_t:CDS:1 n=1 Tax=Cetraspora pellucida TaxID=1433469 RepID=A0A9N8WBZ9_9GLOM|nr:12505_t:CDS:2 [Cetraspora pellucida]
MPRVSKQKAKTHKASQASVNVRKAAHRNKQIQNINQVLIQMDDSELQLTYQSIMQSIDNEKNDSNMQSNDNEKNNSNAQSNNNKKNKLKAPLNDNEKKNQRMFQKLLYTIEQLPDDQLKATIHLLDTMRYFKGPNEGKLLSPYLQDKALNFISSSLYKVGQDSSKLSQYKRKHKQYISKVRASAHRPLLVDSQSLKIGILALFKKNKHQYTSQFISMATQVSQVESSLSSITHQSVIRWDKEISELYINQILNQTEFRAKKCQQLESIPESNSSQKVFNDDNECEKRANKLFKNLFGQ